MNSITNKYIIILWLFMSMNSLNGQDKNAQNPPPPSISNEIFLSQDSLTNIIRNCPTFFGFKSSKSPFDSIYFNKVLAFDYEGYKGNIGIVQDGNFNKKIRKVQPLTLAQVKTFIDKISNSKTYGGNKAFCFEPHLAIVFYNDSDLVAEIQICLECNYLISSSKLPASEKEKVFYGDGKDDYRFNDGFSKNGRTYFNSLCKELNFSHCKEKLESIFDK